MVSDDHLKFLEEVRTRRPVYTYVFFGFNLFIFLLMVFAGGSTNELTLLAFGAKDNNLIAQGEWWRFVTPIFIHIGLLHLLFNSYALWNVGAQVEKLYGPARFVILYVLTGVAGVYGSYYYSPHGIAAGASGAIFGLFGALLIFGIRYRNSTPPFFAKAVVTGVLPVIAINLFIGFQIPSVDNAAHVAGLLAGAALGAVVPFHRPGEETVEIYKGAQMVLLATIAVCFVQVARHYNGPHFSARNLTRGFTQILPTGSASEAEFINAINTAQTTFKSSTDSLESGRQDDLPSLKTEVTKAIDQLRNVPSLAARADQLTADLLRVMQNQYELIEDVQRAGTFTFAHSGQLKENVRDYQKVMTDFSAWVESEGERYGIEKRGR
jgi:rhomboid protease GluP